MASNTKKDGRRGTRKNPPRAAKSRLRNLKKVVKAPAKTAVRKSNRISKAKKVVSRPSAVIIRGVDRPPSTTSSSSQTRSSNGVGCSFPFFPFAASPCNSNTDIMRGNSNHRLDVITPKYKLDDLVGMNTIIEQILEDVIRPFAKPEKAKLLDDEAPRGVLLIGPPGTGKSVLAEAIVHAVESMGTKVNFYRESGTCLSPYLGETEIKLRALFKTAEENGPSVIFFDELDGLTRRRNNGSSSSDTFAPIMATLLTLVNDVKCGRVLLIGATNCPELIDQAMTRSGRFDIKVQIPLPDLAGRTAILEHYLGKQNHTLKVDQLKDLGIITEGCSGSDLEALCKNIHKRARARVFPNGSWTDMTDSKIMTQKKKMKQLDWINDVMAVIPQVHANLNLQQQQQQQQQAFIKKETR